MTTQSPLPTPQFPIGNPQSVRVLILHNRYRQAGGEDVIVADQAALLREKGHAVEVLEKDNRVIDGYGLLRRAMLFFATAENPAAAADVAGIAREFKPHVAHVHNTLPLLSPSIYAPLQRAGVKVIQYLHNYRLACPAGTLFRDGKHCQLCVDEDLSHAVKYRCWTGSKLATLALTRMLRLHRRARTWHTQVDLFVAANSYMRDLLVNKGVLPADRIVVQPSFGSLPEAAERSRIPGVGVAPSPSAEAPPSPHGGEGKGFVFLGRLTPEKGIATLLALPPELKQTLTVIGDGPLHPKNFAQPTDALSAQMFAGPLPREKALERLAGFRALVFPSIWQEGCPATILEAMALGKPVIASRVAGAAELVQDGQTGLLFEPGDSAALAACMRRLQEDAGLAGRLGGAARERFEERHSPQAGYARMLENYARLGLVAQASSL